MNVLKETDTSIVIDSFIMAKINIINPNINIWSWGTGSTFNFIHETGIFKIEFDFYIGTSVNQILFGTNYNTSARGFYIIFTNISGNRKVGIRIPDNIGGYNVNLDSDILSTGIHHFKYIGDGNNFNCYVDNIYSSGTTLSGSYSIGDAQKTFTISVSPLYINRESLANIKIYNGNTLYVHFPFTDINYLSRDLISGLDGTYISSYFNITYNIGGINYRNILKND
jgi:hypothetical protein